MHKSDENRYNVNRVNNAEKRVIRLIGLLMTYGMVLVSTISLLLQ